MCASQPKGEGVKTVSTVGGTARAVSKYISGSLLDEGRTRKDKNDNFISAIRINVEGMPKLNRNLMINYQGEEEEMKQIRDYKLGVMEENDPQFKTIELKKDNFKIIEDLLYVKVGKEPSDFRLWMPKLLREKLIRFLHTKYGHFGAKKVERMAKEICYW